jgi:hypothetical protein
MLMAMPKRWVVMLRAACDEACLATRLYNDPAEVRSFEGFVVHMHLAWLYLLHAKLTRDGIDIRYHEKNAPRRLVKVDGEAKIWELSKCVQKRWPEDANPVRSNVEFFIALRNKIEHRYARVQDALALAVSGYTQAHLLNFEDELTGAFGSQYSLAGRLRFPVFVGAFTPAGEQTLRELQAQLPAALRKFIASYHANLESATRDDPRFELRLRVSLELAPKDPNSTAIQFSRLDDMTDEERAAVEEMGRKGQVIVREQRRPVQHHGWFKPAKACAEVAKQIPFRFTMAQFTWAWKALKVRPSGGALAPEKTDEKYCIYDDAHGDYLYSPRYIDKLVKLLTTEEGYRKTIGREPRPQN